MSRKSERRVGVLRCGAGLLAGLLAVSLLSGCGDGGAKQGSGAAAVSSSRPVDSSGATASSSASGAIPVPASTGASSGVATSPTVSSVAPTTPPSSSPSVASSSAEPAATASTDAATGIVTEHMDASKMPPKPAPPLREALPPVAYTQTKAGAMVTAIGFFKELDYLQATGDMSFFKSAVALEACELCNSMAVGAQQLKAEGKYAVTKPYIVNNARVTGSEGDIIRIEMDLVMQKPVVFSPNDAQKSLLPGFIGPTTIDAQWIDGRWVVTYFALIEE